jgi:hypothetical protein
MNGKTILAAVVAATLVAGAASAQTKGPKLYRWVDKDGKVHYDDALPPEAVNQARKEFDAKTGSVAGQVERALTPEERAALAAAAQKAADAAKVAEEQRHQEVVMMATYANENDMRRAYGERISLLRTTLESTEVSIRNVRENLAIMLSQASEAELAGRKVPPERDSAIRGLHEEFLRQQQFQANRRLELDGLNAEFARMLNRYRELKNAAAANAAADAAPLPNAAPPPGGTP